MKRTVQFQTLKGDELSSRHATQFFGLAMTTVFVVILILNAISYGISS
jgi:hypothetical protein